jgi:hypothetical protein
MVSSLSGFYILHLFKYEIEKKHNNKENKCFITVIFFS